MVFSNWFVLQIRTIQETPLAALGCLPFINLIGTMRRLLSILSIALFLTTFSAFAQERISSPRGEASTQIGGSFEGGSYSGGSWVVVDYGRPILRGRTQVFGSGAEYGKALYAGAPVWRAGANQSTRFMTEKDLKFGSSTLPAGEYSMFVEFNNGEWTLIFSTHKAKSSGRSDEEGLWGSYEYTADKDVLRVKMIRSSIDMSVDQFTISFVNMTQKGGNLAIIWENQLAMTPFTLAN